jgi:cell shape-determining protein MreD
MAKTKKRRFTAEVPHPRLNSRVVEVLAYGLLILLLGLWQAAPRGWPMIGGGRPLLLVPLVASVAMFAGPLGGGAAGVAAGLLWDMYSNRLFGFSGLVLLVIGCSVGLLVRLLLRNNVLSALLLTVGATLAWATVDWLCYYLLPMREGMVFLLTQQVLPNAVYTIALCLPIYGLVRLVTKILKKMG